MCSAGDCRAVSVSDPSWWVRCHVKRSGYQFVMFMLIAKVYTRMVIHLGPPPEVTDSDPRRALREPATAG